MARDLLVKNRIARDRKLFYPYSIPRALRHCAIASCPFRQRLAPHNSRGAAEPYRARSTRRHGAAQLRLWWLGLSK